MQEGEIMAIVGKSGCGKTTLLKCIYGLEDLEGGEVHIDSEKVVGPAFQLIPGHEDMKLVSQDFYVLENHTVEENIFDKLIAYPEEAKQKRAGRLLNLLELNFLKKTKAKYLSSGQKQRVAIARALAVMPKVLLLDEPFSNLDHLLTEKLFSFVLKEVKKGRTSVLLITHWAEEVLKYANTVTVIDEGKVLQSGEKWEVYYRPKKTKLAGLLGEFNLIKKEDLEKRSKLKFKSKLFLRPDKIRLATSNSNCDLMLHILNCSYNGKCYEILAESKNGSTFIIYSGKKAEPDKVLPFYLEI